MKNICLLWGKDQSNLLKTLLVTIGNINASSGRLGFIQSLLHAKKESVNDNRIHWTGNK
ncbi:hypothetical protein IMPR6_290019 [Imperialibacter sp. EC-SDR9]|nr:hypothetical protein IMPERIA89_190048 [Imperialibacter sp. 89]CAD5275160.1 hypothetical protein IMPERIA75_410019 [Imperialibacter sp. 75]VVT19505.1 hypothetical protein IMPR6_290019 [Imperialibacter sp. EC-SDR9]